MPTEIYSAALFKEMEPYFGIIINGRRLIADETRFVERIELEEAERKIGFAKFTIFDTGDLIGEGIIAYNHPVVIELGHRDSFESRGPFFISLIEEDYERGGVLITVTAEEAYKLSTRSSRRVFTTGSIQSVMESILKPYDIPLLVEGDVDLLIDVDDENPVVQSGESDMAFMLSLASSFGWSLSFFRGKAHLTPPAMRRSLGVVQLVYNRADAPLTHIRVTRKKPSVAYVPISAGKPQDRIKPASDAVLADGEFFFPVPLLNPFAPTVTASTPVLPNIIDQPLVFTADLKSGVKWLGDQVQAVSEHVDANIKEFGLSPAPTPEVGEDGVASPRQGYVTKTETRIQPNEYGEARIFTVTWEEPADGGKPADEPPQKEPDTPTAATAEKKKVRTAMRKVLREGRLMELEVTLKFGHTMFVPQQRLEISGVNTRIDGPYRVIKVAHTLDMSGGFITKLTAAAGWDGPGSKLPKAGTIDGKGSKTNPAAANPVDPASTQQETPAPPPAVSGDAVNKPDGLLFTINEFGEMQFK